MKSLFAYYDHSHRIGANIILDNDAKGVLTISHLSNMEDFLQGALRMRKLVSMNQSLNIIASDYFFDNKFQPGDSQFFGDIESILFEYIGSSEDGCSGTGWQYISWGNKIDVQ